MFHLFRSLIYHQFRWSLEIHHFLAFCIWGANWRHLANTTEPSMCGGDAVLCQITLTTCYYSASVNPFPSNRHHRSNGDCLEGKRENYQVCSVQYHVQQLCTVQCTHIWTDVTVLWIEFCLTGPISLCLDSFLCMYVFSVRLYIACICSIVTRWGGPGGFEAYP